jgi:ubiquinone biosynthesis protein COQ9
LNWYSKRAILSGVYSSTVLYWLGDTSPGHAATWEFLDRRIDDVMQFEKVKKAANDSPVLRPFLALPNWLAKQVRPPSRLPRDRPAGAVVGRPALGQGALGPGLTSAGARG